MHLREVTAWPASGLVRKVPQHRLSTSSTFGNLSSPSSRICVHPPWLGQQDPATAIAEPPGSLAQHPVASRAEQPQPAEFQVK
jgi:hypothetical protein